MAMNVTDDFQAVLSGQANVAVVTADVFDLLPLLPEESINAILCDPPYGWAFMGAKWDTLGGGRKYQEWATKWGAELLRVAFPGTVALIFSGARTRHRLAVGLEEAGWPVDDVLLWLYGNGMIKSSALDKAIDRHLGVKRPVVGEVEMDVGMQGGSLHAKRPKERRRVTVTAPGSPEAAAWQGWGTGLRPGHEDILLLRKSRGNRTYAECALEYGTGALNIGGCRLETYAQDVHDTADGYQGRVLWADTRRRPRYYDGSRGRWPPNVALECTCTRVLTGRDPGHTVSARRSEPIKHVYGKRERWPYRRAAGRALVHTDPACPCAMLDAQSGDRPTCHTSRPSAAQRGEVFAGSFQTNRGARGHSDAGGASRFYFIAKTSTAERDAGLLEGYYWRRTRRGYERISKAEWEELPTGKRARGNVHPTLKPLSVCQWLATMLLPPGEYREQATLLVPFAGVMSEVIAAARVGWRRIIAIEWDPMYAEMGRERLEWWLQAAEATGLPDPDLEATLKQGGALVRQDAQQLSF